MFPVLPARESLLIIGLMFVAVATSMGIIQPAWGKARAVRVLVFLAFAGMLGGIAVWRAGRQLERWPLVLTGAGITYIGILVLAPAALVMPLGAGIDRGMMFLTRPRGPKSEPPTAVSTSASKRRVTRRGIIRAGAASLPLMAAATGASGFASAKERPRMPVVRMRYEGLHPDLEGFRILHLSDLHLGACVALADLETALETALAEQRPDLIVVTGDLADDSNLIPGALALIERAAARYGAVASLGNHEYIHDIRVTRPLFESSRVPLLVSSGRTIDVGRARLFVGGADDPVHMHGDIAAMLSPSIASAAARAPTHADFRLLLCHRPEGHGPAAANGFDLTLSGHTHGGQLGLFGRSLFEKLRPGTSWWGTYQKERPKARRPSARPSSRHRRGSTPRRGSGTGSRSASGVRPRCRSSSWRARRVQYPPQRVQYDIAVAKGLLVVT